MDPGPLELIDPRVLRPFVARPSFEGLVARAFGDLAGADARLAGSATHAIADPPDDLDGLFATTVGVAATDVGPEIANASGSPAPEWVGAGDGADTYRQSALPYLPHPDAPITVTFEEAPPLPEGDGGWSHRERPPLPTA